MNDLKNVNNREGLNTVKRAVQMSKKKENAPALRNLCTECLKKRVRKGEMC
jgi:hypothetical protein